MQKKKHLPEIHRDIMNWKSTIKLAEDEMVGYRKQLDEVAGKNTGREIGAHIEHFHNQFIIQQEVLDILKHDLREAEHKLAEMAKGNPAADHILLDPPADLEDRSLTFDRLFQDLKKEFYKFLSTTM